MSRRVCAVFSIAWVAAVSSVAAGEAAEVENISSDGCSALPEFASSESHTLATLIWPTKAGLATYPTNEKIFIRLSNDTVIEGHALGFSDPWLCFKGADSRFIAIDSGDIEEVSSQPLATAKQARVADQPDPWDAPLESAQAPTAEVEGPIEASYGELAPVFELDVFTHYGLTEHNTDLKKKVYKASKEYQQQLAELKKKRADALTKEYFLVLQGNFKERYKLQSKRFEVLFNMLGAGFGTISANPPKSKKLFVFPGLPFTTKKSDVMPRGTEEHLVISMDEKRALDVENAAGDAELVVFFKIKSFEERSFDWTNYYQNGAAERLRLTVDAFITKENRLVLRKTDGTVLFEKKFPDPK